MFRSSIYAVALVFGTVLCGYAQSPLVVSGTVLDPSGAVVVGAVIRLESSTGKVLLTRRTDKAGNFSMVAPEAGSYQIEIVKPQFAVVKREISVGDTALAAMELRLSLAGTQETVTVVDPEKRDSEYAVTESSTAEKTNLSVLETPGSLQVVPRAVLQDQRVLTLSDATRNVAGAAQDFGFNGASEPLLILRGFQATSMTASGTMSGMSAYYVDGTKVQGIPVDMANVQSVEVIKGPETVLYGRAEPGGIINVVPRPFEHRPTFSVEQTGSTYSTSRSIAEVSGPLDRAGRWLGRGAGAWTQNRSNRDFVRDRLGSGWAGIQWKPSYSDQLTLNLSYTDQSYRNDYGIPANLATKRPYDLPWNRAFNDSPDLSYSKPLSASLTGQHTLSEDWSMNGKLIMTVADTHDGDITPYRVDLTTGADCLQTLGDLCRYYYYVNPRGQYRLHQENVDLHGSLRHGIIRHQLLIGGDFYSAVKKGTLYFQQLSPINIFNPVYTQQPKLDIANALAAPTIDINNWNSGYIQDNVSVGTKLHIVGAVRLEGTSAIYSAPGTPLNSQFFASPRVGIVWQFKPNASVYGQYQDAVDANNGRDPATGVALAAERSRQFETGLKYQAPSGAWNATLAIYQLTKRNRADYSLYPTIRTVGEARSRGVELDVLGRLTSRLATIFSYGYTEAVVTVDPTFQGTFLADVPRHGASVWACYVFSKNWTAGVGEFGQSFRLGDQPNSFILPGYGRTDAMLSYGFMRHGFQTTVQANGNNLLNKRYYSGSHQFVQDWIQPGAPRTVLLSLRISR